MFYYGNFNDCEAPVHNCIYDQKHKARKAHICTDCQDPIEVGETYRRVVWVGENIEGMEVYKYHTDCGLTPDGENRKTRKTRKMVAQGTDPICPFHDTCQYPQTCNYYYHHCID